MLELRRVDLHIHTCLSPCAELSMSPRAVVEMALRRELEMIAVCDHNSVENAGAVLRNATGLDLAVLPGMEITTREEVHLLALFQELEAAQDLQALLYDHLPGQNDERIFGLQPVVDAEGYVTGFNPRLLAGAVQLGLEELVDAIHRRGGLAVAAHVDRPYFGLLGQLGFVPDGLDLDALEVSRHLRPVDLQVLPEAPGYPILRSSDAHQPEEIGSSYTVLRCDVPDLQELRRALAGERGRSIHRREVT